MSEQSTNSPVEIGRSFGALQGFSDCVDDVQSVGKAFSFEIRSVGQRDVKSSDSFDRSIEEIES